jgi:predicted nucleic acid-binding protein
MNFDAIPPGTTVFLDANVFTYWFANDPAFGGASTRLLERVETGDVLGVMSAADFSDVAHRLMTLDACNANGWPYAGIGKRLKNRADAVRALVDFRDALDDIRRMGVRIVDVTAVHVIEAADLSLAHGLLSGDALVVAVMQHHRLTVIASNDADFDRVPGIVRYSPL